jgi:hypothetical protein
MRALPSRGMVPQFDRRELLAHHVNDDGYNRLRLCRALAVVKRQLTVALAAFLRVSPGGDHPASGCLIPYPLIQTWRGQHCTGEG